VHILERSTGSGSVCLRLGKVERIDEDKEQEATEVAGVEVHPPQGEQEKSHESEETLSPDEKTDGDDLLEPPSLPGPA
jgi:hypothetical protein